MPAGTGFSASKISRFNSLKNFPVQPEPEIVESRTDEFRAFGTLLLCQLGRKCQRRSQKVKSALLGPIARSLHIPFFLLLVGKYN